MKTIQNGRGTEVVINNNDYISIGEGAVNITIRSGNKCISFDTLEDLINAIDYNKASYYSVDKENTVNKKCS